MQRGSNRRDSSPREEDRARNLDKADKDGDDRTRRKGQEEGKGEGEGRERARVRQTVGAGRERGVRARNTRERVCMQVLSEL